MNLLQLLLWIFCNFRFGFSTTSFSSTQFFLQLTFYFLQFTFLSKFWIFSTTYQKSAFCKCVYNFKGGGNFVLSPRYPLYVWVDFGRFWTISTGHQNTHKVQQRSLRFTFVHVSRGMLGSGGAEPPDRGRQCNVEVDPRTIMNFIENIHRKSRGY